MNAPRQPIPGVVYPPPELIERYVREGVLGDETLIEAIVAALRAHPDRRAVSEPGVGLTHAEVDRRSADLARGLLNAGLSPLDRVLFQLPNSIDLVVSLIGCWRAGLIPVCTLEAHRSSEIGYLGRHVGARALFVPAPEPDDFDHVAFAVEMSADIDSLSNVVVVGDHDVAPIVGDRVTMATLTELEVAGAESQVDLDAIDHDPRQVVVMQLSGGTTGIPKAIPRMSNEYLYNMRQCAEALDIADGEIALIPTPLVHNAAMACAAFPALLRSGELALMRRPDPMAFLTLMQERRPNRFGVAGPILPRLEAFGFKDLVDLEQVVSVISMNSTRDVERILGVPGVHIYGMSEGLVMFSRPDDPDEVRFDTVGTPVSPADEVRIVVPGTENDVIPGEVGELVTRGPYTIHGYFDATERNAIAFTSDRYFRTGDLMSAVDHDGVTYYRFEGRLKDVVDRGGEKISCEEVERHVLTHPSISDVAVVALPDPDVGERACAVVVLAPGADSIDTTQLGVHLEGRGLARYKWPERIEIVEQLPQTKVGKTDKLEARRAVLAGQGES